MLGRRCLMVSSIGWRCPRPSFLSSQARPGCSRFGMPVLGNKKSRRPYQAGGFSSGGWDRYCPSPSVSRDGRARIAKEVTAVLGVLLQWGGIWSGPPVHSGRGAAVIGAQPDLSGEEARKVEVAGVGFRLGVSQMPQRGASSRVQDQQSATTADPRANAVRRHVLPPVYVRPVDRSHQVGRIPGCRSGRLTRGGRAVKGYCSWSVRGV